MAKIDELKDFNPFDRQEWRDWLEENYDKSNGIWFVYFKKQTGKPRVSYEEAVEEALCFGWIDSVARGFDDERSRILFTPRKPKSVWSKPNKMRVEKIIASGAITESGLAKIVSAKKDGSWDALSASDNLEIAADLQKAFDANQRAEKNFYAFTDGVKRVILSWVNAAKREETRKARIEKLIALATENKRVNFDKE